MNFSQPADPDTPLIEADRLARHYRIPRGFLKKPATVKALNEVSFTLRAKHTLAVVGESGCGKSTLARVLSMIEQPTTGTLKIAGTTINTANAEVIHQLRKQIQMVFQNPYASLNPRKTVGQMLSEPLIIHHRLSKAEREKRVQQMLVNVGLRPEFERRYPHMFSGGQRQRIAIARALMLGPRVIIADEPTSALDVSVQAQILNLFMDLQAENALGYVFISHNLSVVEHIANEVMVMYFGNVVEFGPQQAIFSSPRHPYTKALLSATPSIDPQKRLQKIKLSGELPSPLNPPSGCTFHRRCPYATPYCAEVVPALRPFDGRQVACHYVETINRDL